MKLNDKTKIKNIAPNYGEYIEYKKILQLMIKKKMTNDYQNKIDKNYQIISNKIALDESKTSIIKRTLRELNEKWQQRFAFLSQKLARKFADNALRNSDYQLIKTLDKAGFLIKFTLTDEIKNSLQAIVSENVSLIKSIQARYHTNVNSIVMESVTRGRDIHYLYKELRSQFGVTDRRAKLIALDQNNKATSALTQSRQLSLGITHGIWQHSHAGKEPRPSHLKADGKEFELKKGLFLDGEWVMPGQLINCRCTWRPLLPWKTKKNID